MPLRKIIIEYYVLVTAYYVDIEHEYENYLKK